MDSRTFRAYLKTYGDLRTRISRASGGRHTLPFIKFPRKSAYSVRVAILEEKIIDAEQLYWEIVADAEDRAIKGPSQENDENEGPHLSSASTSEPAQGSEFPRSSYDLTKVPNYRREAIVRHITTSSVASGASPYPAAKEQNPGGKDRYKSYEITDEENIRMLYDHYQD